MSRRLLHTLFGLAVGFGARLFLPGHNPVSLAITAVLCLIGAISGGLAAERLFPADTVQAAGFAVSALGAIACLLIYGVATQ
jgi:uncharacterized membrane protein YeaQ/YmgE (transglycosylase-associated protein family)